MLRVPIFIFTILLSENLQIIPTSSRLNEKKKETTKLAGYIQERQRDLDNRNLLGY